MITKNSEIQKIYSTYKCSNNHSVKWIGKEKVYSLNPCFKCGKNSDNDSTLRWGCKQCEQYYCIKCFKVIPTDYCPCMKHKMVLTFISSIGKQYFSEFKCDICFKDYKASEGLWIDIECNYTVCQKCKKDADDVPNILED